VHVKVEQSLYRPGQAFRVPEGWGSQISRQSAREGGKVVSLTHRSPLPPRKYYWCSFLLEVYSTAGAVVRPKGLCQWKIPMTPSGIEPATFRLVPNVYVVLLWFPSSLLRVAIIWSPLVWLAKYLWRGSCSSLGFLFLERVTVRH
jgi:hypothetical protein